MPLHPFLAGSSFAQSQPYIFTRSVSSGADDVEEAASGSVYTNSTDLELVYDNNKTKNQTIGIRFTNITIPTNAVISKAYVQFTTDEVTKKTCTLRIEGQATDHALPFSQTAFDVSSRSRTSTKINWTPSNWNTVNEAAAAQATPDLKAVVQEIVSRPGWKSGNAMALLITGSGKRTAAAFEGSATGAPKLVVEYTVPVEAPVATAGAFPVKKNSVWKYHDKGVDLGTSWTGTGYDDAAWASGAAVLGYGDPVNTSLSFGDSTNKYPAYYLRHTFNVEDAAVYDTLVFNIRRDDGAVVYLNGVEQFRTNMPTGTITYNSAAVTAIGWSAETTYYTFKVPAAQLKSGNNVLAVSLHQANATSSDLLFDMEVTGVLKTVSAPAPETAGNIGNFTSITPMAQGETFIYPSSHIFQKIAKSGTTRYTSGSTSTMPNGNDFTAYVAQSGSSKAGFLSVNHENSPGGVSLLNVGLDEQTMLWTVNGVHKMDFSPVVKTERNCSGGITPWGTVITSEETYVTGDVNADGYQDIGWNVEFDPATNKLRDYDGDGKPDKLWAMGRMKHENVAVGKDGVTVYQGEDGGTSCVYKFVANKAGDLSAGTLYVLKRNASNPSLGDWVQVPNTTQSDRNNTSTLASALGGTNWSNVEDVEFGPDGRTYFSSKVTGTVWRFTDNGSTVSGIEAWVTNQDYPITHEGGTQLVNFGTGIDNLVFDGEGNLWAIQDGGRNNIWVIRKDHTPASPKVEIFASVPIGSEATGLTFTPDFRYGFLSIQNPSTTNTQSQPDASGEQVVFNASTTIVFARKEYLGQAATTLAGSTSTGAAQAMPELSGNNIQVQVYPNPFQAGTQVSVTMPEKAPVTLELLSMAGKKVQTLVNGTLDAGNHSFRIDAKGLAYGMYILRISSNKQVTTQKVMHTGN
ncbi:alkaline phosphatase PhoX [Pontibacter brevis]